MKNLLLSFIFLSVSFPLANLTAQTTVDQKPDLTYYLPDISYDKNIPTPEEFLGYQVGEWHASHDQLAMYMRELARVSDRITIEEYARSYENRPLYLLTITSTSNHQNIEEIRKQHVAISDPAQNANITITDQPSVIYQGFSIHGNEPSGSNASLMVAYYLAAGQGNAIEQLLQNTIILLDPSFNPDGFHRFSTWANTHKNKNIIADPNDREYDEAWPRGRTNHYWFDLNRDWLLVQHPESRGRIKNFHKWKPNILTDHHEMGTSSTFFFMPGIQTRVHPLTPKKNQELTLKIGMFHKEALDNIESLYYTEEDYDDFYYGKGSTYPDANGCIGILFEQASSRGHAQETDNGLLTFPFTIRNQVKTALSTQKAGLNLRKELLEFQKEFYRNNQQAAKSDPIKGYVFGDEYDHARVQHLVDILTQHHIDVYKLDKAHKADGLYFHKESAYVVPTDQTQYKLIKAVFEKRTTFEDSLFYDISAWTLPLAFNLSYAELEADQFGGNLLGEKVSGKQMVAGKIIGTGKAAAYVMHWDEYYAPAAVNELLEAGLMVKVAQRPFIGETAEGTHEFDYGAIQIPLQNQKITGNELKNLITAVAKRYGVDYYALTTGYTAEGIDMGSRNFSALHQPKVMLIIGDGVSSYEAGELWHLLDQRYNIPLSKVSTEDVAGADLSRYTTIIMVDGGYSNLRSSGTNKIKEWVKNGGNLILQKSAIRWGVGQGLSSAKFKSTSHPKSEVRPYHKQRDDSGARVIGGAIGEVEIDNSHPLAYGYRYKRLPVFRRGTLFLEPTSNPYATPFRYTNDPLLSGYISTANQKTMSESAAVIVNRVGGGQVINLADNPSFRAFWFGTNKLMANAIFFGEVISGSTMERVGE